MKRTMPALRAAPLALVATALLIAGGPAGAQTVKEITVEAPRTVTRQVGQNEYGAPILATTVRIRVSYADLDLSKPSGADTLQTRIDGAAKDACHELDKLYPFDPDANCVGSVVKAAAPQAQAAIAAARP
jgi:UrcA family protein